jgi:hypothetical protein
MRQARRDGRKELAALADGYRESAGRMRAPVLPIGDAALGVLERGAGGVPAGLHQIGPLVGFGVKQVGSCGRTGEVAPLLRRPPAFGDQRAPHVWADQRIEDVTRSLNR